MVEREPRGQAKVEVTPGLGNDRVSAVDEGPVSTRQSDSRPGFYPAEHGGLGTWVVHVPGGGAFGLNAVSALSHAAKKRQPGPSRELFLRIAQAFIEASPNYE